MITPELALGLRKQLGDEFAEILLHPLAARDGTATIQRPDHPHSKAVAALLHALLPGHREQLCVGRPCDVATSVAVVTVYQGQIAIGRKVEQDRFYVGKYCLAPGGWFDDVQDTSLADTILREAKEELDFEPNLSRVYSLGTFITINDNDAREASYPSHKLGFYYELLDDEWEQMLSPKHSPSEVEDFGLFNEAGFAELVAKQEFVFVDQIEFVRRFFRHQTEGTLSRLEPVVAPGRNLLRQE
jgi:ADP-ribose pyrophosphatase YjhB (NUDIX family)